MANSLLTVLKSILAPSEDNTPFTQVLDFKDLDAKKTDLSPEAIKVLLAGRNDADNFQRSFESVAAKKSQPVVQPRVKSRAAQSQTPSQYRIAKDTRTSIVTGETSKPEKDDDKEPEITYGPKY